MHKYVLCMKSYLYSEISHMQLLMYMCINKYIKRKKTAYIAHKLLIFLNLVSYSFIKLCAVGVQYYKKTMQNILML